MFMKTEKCIWNNYDNQLWIVLETTSKILIKVFLCDVFQKYSLDEVGYLKNYYVHELHFISIVIFKISWKSYKICIEKHYEDAVNKNKSRIPNKAFVFPYSDYKI